jgi:hypothetical protein
MRCSSFAINHKNFPFEITKDKDGYNGKKIRNVPLERSNKICQLCFLIDCPLYDNERSFFEKINRLNINFCNLDVKGKFLWLMANEEHLI